MGTINSFTNEKLIIGIIYNPAFVDFTKIENTLKDAFGEIDYKSIQIPFTHTEYYNFEMGSPIHKVFLSFKNLISPTQLSGIKIKTNELEEIFLSNDKMRKVNLDPGSLSLSKLILASTKNFSHRIPLEKGIYGEVTLMYRNKKWEAFPHTFPDFKTKEYSDILTTIRNIYRTQI